MNKRPRKLDRFFSLFLAFLMVTSVVFGMHLTVKADEITKTEKSYDIAMVFDNSGSMYGTNSPAWCRAKYAMEIFASMLNYEKDKLHIFPMWEVTTDGSQPDSGGSYAAIEVKSKEDIDKISNMYTVEPKGTPFAPVLEAYDYLKTSKADEKWLIILNDGEFDRKNRKDKASAINWKDGISSLVSNEIKVQYLGFAEAKEKAKDLKTEESKNFFVKTSDDKSLKDDLIEICNYIFQRSILPDNRLNKDKGSLNLDLSMKNLIVFAQGSNVKITSLKNSKGEDIAITLDSGQRKYSEIRAGNFGENNYQNASVDKTLSGRVVTFAACPKGNYTLSYSGADKIQIFYEPDVNIDVSLVNNDGERITKKDDFVAGEYTVTSRIVDSTTGEDVTAHELMGKDVKLKTCIKTSKDQKYKDYENGSKVVFEPDEKTDIYIEGEYLGKYKISSKDNPKLAWLSNINIQPSFAELAIKASVLQPDSWYIIKDHNKWKPVRVAMTLDGRPLTDEELSRTNLRVDASNGLKVRYEPLPGESAYNIYISQNEKGEYIKPETGSYRINVAATYTNEFGQKAVSNSEKVDFQIQKFSKFWQTLIRIVITLLILALIIFFLTRKAWPNRIRFVEQKDNGKTRSHKVKINAGGRKIGIFPVQNAFSVTGKRKTKVYQKFSKSAAFEVVSTNRPRSIVSSFKINGLEYASPEFKNSTGETFNGVIYNNTPIEVSFNDGHGTVSGYIVIN